MVTTASNGSSTGTMALSRTKAQPRRCASITSPANTPVISPPALRVTLSRNRGSTSDAASRISSQIGLPSVMPQVARGSPIMA